MPLQSILRPRQRGPDVSLLELFQVIVRWRDILYIISRL